MPHKANITDLVETLELQNDELQAYFDRQTGKVEQIGSDDFAAAEDDELADNAPDWQRDTIELAAAIEADTEGRFVALPGADEVDEWDIMARFADSRPNATHADALAAATHGSGAFRRFREQVDRLGLTKQWYAYREDALRRIALDWCAENRIEVEEAAAKR